MVPFNTYPKILFASHIIHSLLALRDTVEPNLTKVKNKKN